MPPLERDKGLRIRKTGGPCLALDEVLFLDFPTWRGWDLKLLLAMVVQQRQGQRMPYESRESAPPDPLSRHLVSRCGGQHTRAIVSSVVGCMWESEPDANGANR